MHFEDNILLGAKILLNGKGPSFAVLECFTSKYSAERNISTVILPQGININYNLRSIPLVLH